MAVATARPLSGGRNVAVARANPVEGSSFAPQIGVSDNSLYRYDEFGGFDSQTRDNSQSRQSTPFVNRLGASFAPSTNETSDSRQDSRFQLMMQRGISMYEETVRMSNSRPESRPGAVMNYLF